MKDLKEFLRKYPLSDILDFIFSVLWGGFAVTVFSVSGTLALLFGLLSYLMISRLMVQRNARTLQWIVDEQMTVIELICGATTSDEKIEILRAYRSRVDAVRTNTDPDTVTKLPPSNLS